MLPALALMAVLSQTADADVRAALEDQLPLPARPLALPAPAAKPVAPGMKVRESARLNGKGKALGREDRDATGQARAAEVRKNMKKPHPPKP